MNPEDQPEQELEATTQVSPNSLESLPAEQTTVVSNSDDFGETKVFSSSGLASSGHDPQLENYDYTRAVEPTEGLQPPATGQVPGNPGIYQQDPYGSTPQTGVNWSDSYHAPQYLPNPATSSGYDGYGEGGYEAGYGAADSLNYYQPKAKKRNWGVIVLSVLAVLSIAGVSVVAYWTFTSRNDGTTSNTDNSVATGTLAPNTEDNSEDEQGHVEQTPDAKPAPAGAQEITNFTTPSQNIQCALSTDEVSCSVINREWTQDCPSGSGTVTANKNGSGLKCELGTQAGGPILNYGQSAKHGNVACSVSENGADCWNVKSGRGFTVRREDWTSY